MGAYCSNETGDTHPIYTDTTLAVQDGWVHAAEMVAWVDTWAGSHAYYPAQLDRIYYKSDKDGTMKYGWVMNDHSGFLTPYLQIPRGYVTNPYDGVTYACFQTRKALPYYNSAGVLKGLCTAGARVLTNDTTPGQTMPWCMRAMYVETAENSNIWIYCSGATGQYGFIDTGIREGNSWYTIGIYPAF